MDVWMIPLLSSHSGEEKFVFKCKGTEIYIQGVLNDIGWQLTYRVFIFGVTAYGCNNYQTTLSGTWISVLFPFLQKILNTHGSFISDRNFLLQQMRVLWKFQ